MSKIDWNRVLLGGGVTPRSAKLAKVASISAGVIFAGASAAAATNWAVQLASGSTAAAQSASITPLQIVQATPVGTLTNQLYPGANGDVTVKITNPNAFPVTITGFTFGSGGAVGYSDPSLGTPIGSTCGASTSLVSWKDSAAHTLNTPSSITVAANNSSSPLVVTLTNAATMGANSPAACAGAYFQLPSLGGVAASGGAATVTTGPVTVSLN